MSAPVSYSVKWGVVGGVVGWWCGSVFVEMDFVSVLPFLKLVQPEPAWQVGSTSFILASKIGTELMFV